MLILIGQNNGLEGKRFFVPKSMTVGRSRACDLFLADGRASRRQARFYRDEENTLFVEDLGSLNGSLCNGELINSRVLKEGDVLCLGSTEFVVENYRVEQPASQKEAVYIEREIPEDDELDETLESAQLEVQLLRADLPPSMRDRLRAKAEQKEKREVSQKRDPAPVNETIDPINQGSGVLVEVIDSPVQTRLIKKHVNTITVPDASLSSEASIEALKKKTKVFAILFEVSSLVQNSKSTEELLSAHKSSYAIQKISWIMRMKC